MGLTMTSLQDLPPDQRATLTLLLGRRKSYDEVASLLSIEPSAVHDRAHAALAILQPRLARNLDADARERIGEYLLGRQDEDTAAQTKAQLALSAPQREWARAIALQLMQIATDPLPPIPDARRPSHTSRDGGQPASSRGGAIVLALLAAIAIAAVLIALNTGGSGKPNATQSASTHGEATHSKQGAGAGTHHETSVGKTHKHSNHAAKTSPTTGASGNGTTGASGNGTGEGTEGSSAKGAAGKRKIESQMNLTAAEEGSSAAGVLLVVSERGEKGLLLDAESLPPTGRFVYYLWLVDSTGKAQPYAIEAPSVPSSGKSKERMIAVTLLPETASSYDEVELTKQTEAKPTAPSSEVVLKGSFSLH